MREQPEKCVIIFNDDFYVRPRCNKELQILFRRRTQMHIKMQTAGALTLEMIDLAHTAAAPPHLSSSVNYQAWMWPTSAAPLMGLVNLANFQRKPSQCAAHLKFCAAKNLTLSV
jgi:hypothetical protein